MKQSNFISLFVSLIVIGIIFAISEYFFSQRAPDANSLNVSASASLTRANQDHMPEDNPFDPPKNYIAAPKILTHMAVFRASDIELQKLSNDQGVHVQEIAESFAQSDKSPYAAGGSESHASSSNVHQGEKSVKFVKSTSFPNTSEDELTRKIEMQFERLKPCYKQKLWVESQIAIVERAAHYWQDSQKQSKKFPKETNSSFSIMSTTGDSMDEKAEYEKELSELTKRRGEYSKCLVY